MLKQHAISGLCASVSYDCQIRFGTFDRPVLEAENPGYIYSADGLVNGSDLLRLFYLWKKP